MPGCPCPRDGPGAEERPTIPSRTKKNRPSAGFDSFDFSPKIRRGIADAGFQEPRPIQAQTIPAALDQRDVMGLAQTGTGKTAAFVLPILERLAASNCSSPRALIVAPTRELAAQIQAETELLSKHTHVRSIAVFGGVPASQQIRALKRGIDILIACPGRLLDLHEQGVVRLDRIEVLVLDEADHMFDMGFLPSIRRIIAALPARRQNLLFSATMPREIRHLADRVLQRPKVVELANSRPAETIEHALYPVAEGRKVALLERLVEDEDFTSAIVFLRTKHRARRLAERLSRGGHSAVALQGNMSQSQRDKAMRGFRDGQYDILVATDIAARGIDVAGISHVINFDIPNTPDAYTHRIGRTGRSECSGKACTLMTPADHAGVRAIEKRIGARIERRHVDGFDESGGPTEGLAGRRTGPAQGHGRRGGPAKRGPARGAGKKKVSKRRARINRLASAGIVVDGARTKKRAPKKENLAAFGQGIAD